MALTCEEKLDLINTKLDTVINNLGTVSYWEGSTYVTTSLGLAVKHIIDSLDDILISKIDGSVSYVNVSTALQQISVLAYDTNKKAYPTTDITTVETDLTSLISDIANIKAFLGLPS